MEANGSQPPRFDFDEQRTYFQATLPAHPEYGALSALRDAAHLRALGDDREAFHRIESAWVTNPASAVLASEMIRAYAKSGEIEHAEEVLETFEAQGPESAVSHVANTLIDVLLEAGEENKARRLLRQNRPALFGQDAIDAAILARRVRDSRAAHRYFERAGDAVYADPRALLEFAQTKLRLASEAHRQRQGDSKPPISHRSPGASGARHPARRLAGPPCLGVAGAGPRAALAAGADPGSRRRLSQGDQAAAG